MVASILHVSLGATMAHHFAKCLRFYTEPIVLWLSLLSGFSDALIFTCLESFQLVYKQYGFGTIGVGLAFLP
jgi:hypothetical protein